MVTLHIYLFKRLFDSLLGEYALRTPRRLEYAQAE